VRVRGEACGAGGGAGALKPRVEASIPCWPHDLVEARESLFLAFDFNEVKLLGIFFWVYEV
jgi:hypothetical protein